jgi:hypothetical protein
MVLVEQRGQIIETLLAGRAQEPGCWCFVVFSAGLRS